MTAAELEKELKKEFQGLSAREKRAYEEMNKEDARQVKERGGGKKRKDEMEVEVPSSEDEAIADQKESGKEKAKKKEKKVSDQEKFENAVASCNMGEPPTVKDLEQWYSSAGKKVTDRTIRNWVKNFGFYIDKNTGCVVKSEQKKQKNP